METKQVLGVCCVSVFFLLVSAYGEKRQMPQITRPAFSAGLTQMVNVSDHVNVVYDRVFLDIGNSYDPSTGIFTAPFDGTYMFSFYSLAETNGTLWLDMYVNDKYISSAYSHVTEEYGASSNSAVIYLIRGDKAYIMGRGTSLLYGDPHEVYCTFSGYLLFYSESS